MPKINVYLPDDLAAAVRETGLSVSPICQKALAEAVRAVGAAREAAAALRDPGFDPRRQPHAAARVEARMTPRFRRALRRAADLAGGPGAVGATDVLVGVIDEPGNMGVHVLESLGVDVPALRAAAVRTHERVAAGGHPDEELLGALSVTARGVVAAALEAATDLGHDFLGCEHLVLGLASESGGPAAELLRDAGVHEQALRRAIHAALAAAASGTPAVAARLDAIDRRLAQLDERLRAGGL